MPTRSRGGNTKHAGSSAKLPPDKPTTRSTSSKTKIPKHSNVSSASPLSSVPSPVLPTQKRKLPSTDAAMLALSRRSRHLASATCWRHVECARVLWPFPIRVRACCVPRVPRKPRREHEWQTNKQNDTRRRSDPIEY